MPSPPSKKRVLSASRRTDIPAFYMPWFMDRIAQGTFEVENPYNGRITRVPATPDAVHTLAFWSKDFGPFLRGGFGETLAAMGYHLFFNFTINSEDRDLEPQVPPLDQRLEQLAALCGRFSPRAVLWRFDPICYYRNSAGFSDNLGDFDRIAHAASRLGVERCITSFLDLYPKIRKRTESRSGISFLLPPMDKQREVLLALNARLKALHISLFTCCEQATLDTLPPEAGISPSACIPGRLLTALYGGGISLRKDPGQRAGCGCTISSDIGSYKTHPCHHNCLFCYANPAAYSAGSGRRKQETTGSFPT